MVGRRSFLKLSLKLLGVSAGMAAFGNVLHAGKVFAAEVKAKIERITMTDEEWKKKLSSEQYDVLREEGTERAFTSPLNEEKREGVFVCAGCDFPLFPAKFKYNSGTGWPSFYDVLPGHVETRTDYKIGLPRTEYHCAKCGGHQGHVFEDGPDPTGLRYCNNGVALKFVPDKGDI
jgi:peptide-methionine (R)-S-oxide reductase